MIPIVLTGLYFVTALSFLSIVGIILYVWYGQQKQKRSIEAARRAQEREVTRQRLLAFLNSERDCISNGVEQFSRAIDFESGYFANHQLTTWRRTFNAVFTALSAYRLEELDVGSKDLDLVRTFIDEYRNAESHRDNYNKRFVEAELTRYASFFDGRIEGKKLDLQQRTAIVTDEDNNLVIAGAGTGKTTTILGKVHYIVERYEASPQEILLISFTNKSASDLANRIDIEGIEVKTFHKFGKDVIQEVQKQPPSIFDEEQFQPLITRFFKELIQSPDYLARVTEFFTDYLKRPKSPFEFENQGEYIQYLKDHNFRTYKQKEIEVKGRTTYRMEVVKSIEECKIANFLFFNNIQYEYEFPYEFDTPASEYRAYKPDFTIEQNGSKVYVEHLAVARDGNIPRFFAKEGESYQAAKQRYWDKIRWARATHRSHRTKLVETYSYEMSEGILFEKLTQKLNEAGITLRPKSPEEIWQIITEAAKDKVDSFLTLLRTFITLMKSNNHSIADVRQRNMQTRDDFENKRNGLLLEIVEPLFDRYKRHLTTRKEIDFSDMINTAASYIADGKHAKRYRYVIIDEFQDISIGRYQLVRAIKQRNPACKLFCVGDD